MLTTTVFNRSHGRNYTSDIRGAIGGSEYDGVTYSGYGESTNTSSYTAPGSGNADPPDDDELVSGIPVMISKRKHERQSYRPPLAIGREENSQRKNRTLVQHILQRKTTMTNLLHMSGDEQNAITLAAFSPV